MIPPALNALHSSAFNTGDLVRVKLTDPDIRNRSSGIVLKFDVHHPDDSGLVIPIVEVLWDDGPSWIDRDRIELCEVP